MRRCRCCLEPVHAEDVVNGLWWHTYALVWARELQRKPDSTPCCHSGVRLEDTYEAKE